MLIILPVEVALTSKGDSRYSSFSAEKIPLMNSDRTDYYIFIIQVCVIVAGCAPAGGKVEEKLFNNGYDVRWKLEFTGPWNG